jgi:hypothetical protein
MAVQLRTTPVTLSLGERTFTLRFNLNAALLIREAGKDGADVWEQIGEKPVPKGAPKGTEPEKLFRVDYEKLRVYLWAMLQDGANKRGEELTIEAVGELIEQRDDVMCAAAAVAEEIACRWEKPRLRAQAKAAES